MCTTQLRNVIYVSNPITIVFLSLYVFHNGKEKKKKKTKVCKSIDLLRLIVKNQNESFDYLDTHLAYEGDDYNVFKLVDIAV
jgi:hypothetical protein